MYRNKLYPSSLKEVIMIPGKGTESSSQFLKPDRS